RASGWWKGVAGKSAEVFLDNVRAGQDRQNAGRGARGSDIDTGDPRVGMGRPHDPGPRHPRQIDVVGEVTPPGQESPVFLPNDARSYPGVDHSAGRLWQDIAVAIDDGFGRRDPLIALRVKDFTAVRRAA